MSTDEARLLWLHELDPASNAYNVRLTLELGHDPGIENIRRALDELVQRHPVLACRFGRNAEGAAAKEVLDEFQIPLRPVTTGAEGWQAAIDRGSLQPFDLFSVPPIRACLANTEPRTLILMFHHILADGVASQIIKDELLAILQAYQTGLLPGLDAPINSELQLPAAEDPKEDIENRLAFWAAELDGMTPLALPSDEPRESMSSECHLTTLSSEMTAGLMDLTASTRSTMTGALAGVIAAWLQRWTAQDDIALAVALSGRSAVAQRAVGFFVRTLPLRVTLEPEITFEALARTQSRKLLRGASNYVSYDRALAQAGLQGSGKQAIDVMLVHNGDVPEEADTNAAEAEHCQSLNPDARFAVEVSTSIVANSLRVELEFRSGLLSPELERAATHDLTRVFRWCLEDPHRAIRHMPPATWVAKTAAAASHASESIANPITLGMGSRNSGTLHGVVLRQLAHHASMREQSVALVSGDESATFGDIADEVSRLCRHLIEIGVSNESRVVIELPRGRTQVTAILAVLLAGGVAVPIATSDPPSRRRAVLLDSGATAVISDKDAGVVSEALNVRRVDLDNDDLQSALSNMVPTPLNTLPGYQLAPSAAAYIIYTSGSTGRPKGVVVEHRQLANLADELDRNLFSPTLEGTGRDQLRVAMTSAVTFDVSWQGLLSLMYGHELHLIPEHTRTDPHEYVDYLHSRQFDLMDITPTHLGALVDAGLFEQQPPKTIVVAGEAFSPALWEELGNTQHDTSLLNYYGPTETTVYVTGCPVTGSSRPRIGKPLSGTDVYLLDRQLRPVLPGVRAEVYVAGAQVARGYLNQPGLTAQRFLPNPYGNPGSRMYRTGDLARWDHEGNLIFDGRADQQVKIRGFRVEIGEVEAALTSHPKIGQAAVIVRERAGLPSLIGYVTPAAPETSLDPRGLRRHAAAQLPQHMTPDQVIPVPQLPLTSSGKLDQRSLPHSGTTRVSQQRCDSRSPHENLICSLFAETLEISHCGPDDDFFELGGYSLLGTKLLARLRTRLGRDFRIRDLLDHPTPAALALLIQGRNTHEPLTARKWSGRAPLSDGQRRLWFINQAEGPSANYTIPIALRVRGVIDRKLLIRSVSDVIKRHEALRSVVSCDSDGEPWQTIVPTEKCTPTSQVETTQQELTEAVDIAVRHPFDLSSETPFRTWLFTVAPDDQVLLMLVHHIAGDEESTAILKRDLIGAYQARFNHQDLHLPKLPVQYADYAVWQRETLGSPDDPESKHAAQSNYWQKRLAKLPVELDLPTDRARPTHPTGQGHAHSRDLSPTTHLKVHELARQHRASSIVVFRAAVSVLLHRLGAGKDIPLGGVISMRIDEALADTVGFMVNTQVLRLDLSGKPTFSEFIDQVRDTSLAAYDNHDLPFERIVEVVNPPRSLSRHPLFQTMVIAQAPSTTQAKPGLSITDYPVSIGACKFDLMFSFTETTNPGGADTTTAQLEASQDLFDEATADHLLQWFTQLIDALVETPTTPVHTMPFLPPDTAAAVLVKGTGRTVEPRLPGTITTAFDEQVRKTPDGLAVIAENQLTYRELDDQARDLAAKLSAYGIGDEGRVAILTPRSATLIVATLAILKAGGVYVPLNTSDPDQRIQTILKASHCSLLLTTPAVAERAAALGIPHLVIDTVTANPAEARPSMRSREAPKPASLAYVMFTSGSTGIPKGVAVTHQNVVDLAADTRWDGHAHRRILLHSPTAFDASTYELWVPLLRGNTIVVLPAGDLDLSVLRNCLRQHKVSAAWMTSGLFQLIADLDPSHLTGLTELWTGGDVVPARSVRAVQERLPDLKLHNGFGPTETTTFASSYAIPATLAQGEPVPIGSALDNTQLLVLDEALAPVPDGIVGDLYVGGSGLARGYLGPTSLTAERFVANPYGQAGSRMYRTGDRAAWKDANLVFHGRKDDQLKLRGHRIETGEIESTLATHRSVGQAIVVPVGSTAETRQLVAYVTAAPGHQTPESRLIMDFVNTILPPYAVPAQVRVVDTIPLTANGKVDRRSLASAQRPSSLEPSTPLEAILCKLFADVLQATVSPNDGFFSLGGNSLLVVRLLARIRAALNIDLSIRDVFDAPSPALLARQIDRPNSAQAPRPPVTHGIRPGTPAPMQLGLWYLHQADPSSSAYNVPFIIRISGPLDLAAFSDAIGDLLARHDVLRTTYNYVHGEPATSVQEHPDPILRVVRTDTTPKLAQMIQTEAQQRFDLSTELPIRALLIQDDSTTEQILILTMHHIAVDAWSIEIMRKELALSYQARVRKTNPLWPPLPFSYADYAAWQTRVIGTMRAPTALAQTQLDYWQRRLAQLPLETSLPSNRPRPSHGGLSAESLEFSLGIPTSDKLNAFAQESDTSLQAVLQAGVAAVLARSGSGSDLTIGTPVTGRHNESLHDIVGYFVNMVALRIAVDANSTFRQLVAQARTVSLEAFSRQDIPFEWVVNALNPSRHPARNPLFQTMVTLATIAENEPTFDSSAATFALFESSDPDTAKFDLSLTFTQTDTISCKIIYPPQLFDHETIRQLAADLTSWMETAATNPDQRIGPLLPARPTPIPQPRSTPRGDLDCSEPSELRPRLLRLFSNLLETETVNPTDDFFTLGGNSLMAVRLASLITRAFEQQITLRDILQARSVAGIEQHLLGRRAPESNPFSSVVSLRKGEQPSLYCMHPLTGLAWGYTTLANHLDESINVAGVQAAHLDADGPPHTSIEQLAAEHASVLTADQPDGPFHLLGWSFGGLVAHATAIQLQSLGRTVKVLCLLDSYPLTEIGQEEAAQAVQDTLAYIPAQVSDALEGRRQLDQVVSSYMDLARAHTPGHFSGTIMFVRSSDAAANAWNSWQSHATDVTHLEVEAAHHAMMGSEASEQLSTIINRVILGRHRL